MNHQREPYLEAFDAARRLDPCRASADAMASIAVSLKRIADALEMTTTETRLEEKAGAVLDQARTPDVGE